MSILEVILIFYVLPMIVVGVGLYFDEGTRTMGHWLDDCGFVFIPLINFITCFIVISIFIDEKLLIKERWKKFRDLKIKKDKDEIE